MVEEIRPLFFDLRAGGPKIRQPKQKFDIEIFNAKRWMGEKNIFYRNPKLKMDLEIVLPRVKQITHSKKIFSHNTPPVFMSIKISDYTHKVYSPHHTERYTQTHSHPLLTGPAASLA